MTDTEMVIASVYFVTVHYRSLFINWGLLLLPSYFSGFPFYLPKSWYLSGRRPAPVTRVSISVKIIPCKTPIFILLYLCFLAVSLRFELNLEHGIILNMDFE